VKWDERSKQENRLQISHAALFGFSFAVFQFDVASLNLLIMGINIQASGGPSR
jgi:hypothetical protein